MQMWHRMKRCKHIYCYSQHNEENHKDQHTDKNFFFKNSPLRGTFCRATCWSCRICRQSLRQVMVAKEVAFRSSKSWSKGEGPWEEGRPSILWISSLCWPCAWLIIWRRSICWLMNILHLKISDQINYEVTKRLCNWASKSITQSHLSGLQQVIRQQRLPAGVKRWATLQLGQAQQSVWVLADPVLRSWRAATALRRHGETASLERWVCLWDYG